ncbi:hypothetical protein MYAM1_002468 [Malassezia yamatoensis]|uniref:Uncharacterized protein n=1 Tax=Malassezia yamatoensis TaxID=253288 RepID=A0AAJ5YS79_9BASI|nr:hypothetical protein MYAM1_002468 [Malassezia yamatoensis]
MNARASGWIRAKGPAQDPTCLQNRDMNQSARPAENLNSRTIPKLPLQTRRSTPSAKVPMTPRSVSCSATHSSSSSSVTPQSCRPDQKQKQVPCVSPGAMTKTSSASRQHHKEVAEVPISPNTPHSEMVSNISGQHSARTTPTFPWQAGWDEQLPRYRELAKMPPSQNTPTTPQSAARYQNKRDAFADVEQVWRYSIDTPTTRYSKRKRTLDSSQTKMDHFLLSRTESGQEESAKTICNGSASESSQSQASSYSSSSSILGEASDEVSSPARAWLHTLGSSPTHWYE